MLMWDWLTLLFFSSAHQEQCWYQQVWRLAWSAGDGRLYTPKTGVTFAPSENPWDHPNPCFVSVAKKGQVCLENIFQDLSGGSSCPCLLPSLGFPLETPLTLTCKWIAPSAEPWGTPWAWPTSLSSAEEKNSTINNPTHSLGTVHRCILFPTGVSPVSYPYLMGRC